MGEADLVAQAKAGDRGALDELLRTHYSSWYQICRRMTGNDADAADATQEAMIAVVKGLPRFDGRAKFSTWSHRVVINKCHDEMRRRKRRPTPTEAATDDLNPQAPHPPTGATNGADPAGGVVATMHLDEKLAQLDDDQRKVLVLRDLTGCDYAEMAEILDVPIGTVRSRLARARRKLADLYTADAPTPAVGGGNFSAPTSVKEVDTDR